MIRILQWLFMGHVHHWKEDARGDLTVEHRDGACVISKDHGVRVFCTCTKCGVPRKFDLA